MTETQATDEKSIKGTWNIDPAHSEVSFTIRHLMSKVRGLFTGFSGTITATGDDPTSAAIDVAIDVTTISTNNEMRDNHIKSNEILGTETSPEITFKSNSITDQGNGKYAISGDLTLNGTTKTVVLDAEFFGKAVDAFGVPRIGAEASTTINRKDFGVDFNLPVQAGGALLGDALTVTLTVEATAAE